MGCFWRRKTLFFCPWCGKSHFKYVRHNATNIAVPSRFCSSACYEKYFMPDSVVKRRRERYVREKIDRIRRGDSGVEYYVDRHKRFAKAHRPLYPCWCVACGAVRFVTASNLIRRTIQICERCASFQFVRLCFCGLPNVLRRGSCGFHGNSKRLFWDFTGRVKKMTATMDREHVVQLLVKKVHAYAKRWREAEFEICVGLLELEKLKAHECFKAYSTFSELMEGEFGRSEIRYRSAVSMLKKFGADIFKTYGRETLQSITRIEDEGEQKKVFNQVTDFRNRRNGKMPSTGTVNKWVQDALGKVKEGVTPQRLVDVKKRYIELLEENRKLQITVSQLRADIIRLNRLLHENGFVERVVKLNIADRKRKHAKLG
jgi:hypothetical protein